MKTFKVRLQAMCAEKIGIFLQAHATTNEKVFSGPSIALFSSVLDLDAACESVGVACIPWGGPDADAEWNLTSEQLKILGFKLSRNFSSARPISAPAFKRRVERSSAQPA